MLVALNLSGESRHVELTFGAVRVIEATHRDRLGSEIDSGDLELRPDEGLVAEVEAR